MKMFYGKTPIKSLNIKHFEVSTNDATLKASDLQSGITAYAKGKKVTGTGKSFEFARYGLIETNKSFYIPSDINVIEIASIQHPVRLTIALSDMKNVDFTTMQTIGSIVIDNVFHDIIVQASNNMITISCDEDISLEVFYGKDNYT